MQCYLKFVYDIGSCYSRSPFTYADFCVKTRHLYRQINLIILKILGQMVEMECIKESFLLPKSIFLHSAILLGTKITFQAWSHCLKRPKINEKRPGLAHFFNKVRIASIKDNFCFYQSSDQGRTHTKVNTQMSLHSGVESKQWHDWCVLCHANDFPFVLAWCL